MELTLAIIVYLKMNRNEKNEAVWKSKNEMEVYVYA